MVVLVSDFAQLACDVYNDAKDNDLRTTDFNKAWMKINTWTSLNQFDATFYKNTQTNVGVLVIRGTVTTIHKTLIEDLTWAEGDFIMRNMPQFTNAIQFYIFLQNLPSWKETTEKYVCGHSLGGMLSKALAPITGLNTIAFNSPDMRKYLKENHFNYNLSNGQKQITYAAKKDFIGNLLSSNDIKDYVLIDPPANLDNLKDNLHPLFWHSMSLLYTTIKNGTHKNDIF